MNRFKDIVDRAEEVRKQLGLNKAQFSARMGMSPQTYNNFVGKQSSKPNVELILGIVQAFGVEPMWLLNGDRDAGAGSKSKPIEGRISIARLSPKTEQPSSVDVQRISALKTELELLVSSCRASVTPLLSGKSARNTHVGFAIGVLTHFFYEDPVGTAAQVVELLAEFKRIAAEMERVHR
jgi:transcriptional regulator with XRE-family HTH domain